MQILPAIDIINGECVRLLRGEFSTAHRVADSALEVARFYKESGAEMIHVVDLDGARDGKRRNTELVTQMVKAVAPAKLELGGGIRSLDDIEEVLGTGVARVVLGSTAVRDEKLLENVISEFGGRIAVGIDAQDGLVKVSGWTEDTALDYVDFARKVESLGIQTIIFTDIDTDGALRGPSLDRLRALREALDCRLIASGGVSSNEDVISLMDAGMDGVIIGKAIYAGTIDLKKAIMEARSCG